MLWHESFREAFIETCTNLALTAKNRIVMNPKKFLFCQKKLECAGFVVEDGFVRPGQKRVEAIKEYSIPKTITDMHGWFGLVNQISPFLAKRPYWF